MCAALSLCSAVGRALSGLSAAALAAAMAAAMVRHDAVAGAIARAMQPQTPPADDDDDDDGGPGASWTDAVESLLPADGPAVPPAVRVQVLANRVCALQSKRLAPLGRRLRAVRKRLAETRRAGRRLRLANRIERLQTVDGWTRLKNYKRLEAATLSTGTNTDGELIRSSGAQRTDKTPVTRSEQRSVDLAANDTTSKRQSEQRPSDDVDAVVGKLTDAAIASIVWLKTVLLVQLKRHGKFAFRGCRTFYAAVYSGRSRRAARFAADLFGRLLVKVTADVRPADGVTTVTAEFVPAAERVVSVTYGQQIDGVSPTADVDS